MTKLSSEQVNFLNHHNIPLGEVFDAAGMSKKDYRPLMKTLGKRVAIGVTPCKKHGHTMRTRHGACFQCRPESLAFHTVYGSSGYVYVAGSRRGQMLKIGFSLSPSERIGILNQRQYGGESDWEMLLWFSCKNAGRVEFEMHKMLAAFNVEGTYKVDSKRTSNCLELFRCDYGMVREAFYWVTLSLNDKMNEIWENSAAVDSYRLKQ